MRSDVPRHTVGPARSRSYAFLLIANSYGAQALIRLNPEWHGPSAMDLVGRRRIVDSEEERRQLNKVFRTFLNAQADSASEETSRYLRISAREPLRTDIDGGFVIHGLGDEWAQVIWVPGYSVPTDLGVVSYDALLMDSGTDDHEWTPAAFIRRSSTRQVLEIGVRALVVPVVIA